MGMWLWIFRSKRSKANKQAGLIYAELRLPMYWRDDPQKAFICSTDIEIVLTPPVLANLFKVEQLTSEQLLKARSSLPKIVSILVLIGATRRLQRLRRLFFDGNSDVLIRSDADLPFPKDSLSFLKDPVLEDLFFEKQWVLLPLKIIENPFAEPLELDIRYRLPFTTPMEPFDSGSYGNVYQVRIAPHCWVKVDGSSWQGEVTVARKIMHSSSTTREDFVKEVKNLQILKRSRSPHPHIMLHIAAYTQGPEFNILSPMAAHGSLEMLFNLGYGRNGKKILKDFEDRFPLLSREGYPPERVIRALLQQCKHIAGALRWLHEEWDVLQNPKFSCTHMDLRPSNILVDKTMNPIEDVLGEWKITDFGISSFRPAGMAGATGTDPRTGRGPYYAPEVHRGGQDRITYKSDIWSYGCILSEVIAFALGQKATLLEFRDERVGDTNHDWFYFINNPNEDPTSSLNASHYELKPWIQPYISRKCFQINSHLDPYINITQDILIIDPTQRPDAEEIWNKLDNANLRAFPP